eukprot:TRINITY_DN4441_c0_g11_i1.p1 TRINITY_DN4441_c0_g11~~TRINITY_DN4441_c0_g11_i1.p1  ORF type:complete len:370 (+),score=71.71 TRINITY_DN4441_c0_g11_i1:54-1163(+)
MAMTSIDTEIPAGEIPAGEIPASEISAGENRANSDDSDFPEILDFHVEGASSSWLRAGACSACGMRPKNEDQHLMLCDWCPIDGVAGSLFAVFDGHGGSAVSIIMSRLLARKLKTVLEADVDGAKAWESEVGRRAAVEQAFLELDQHLATKAVSHSCGSTCTAAIVWRSRVDDETLANEPKAEPSAEADLTDRYKVLVANLGDSRGLLVRRGDNGQLCQVVAETEDHKPENPEEEKRIVSCGGFVRRSYHGMGPLRVNGDLAVSRAFGDFRLKDHYDLPLEKQKVSSMPDIYEFPCKAGDTVILACDGAFDVLQSSQVAHLAYAELGESGVADAKKAAQVIVRTALEQGSTDNVTCVVAHLVGDDNGQA